MSLGLSVKKFSYRPAWYFYPITIFIGINPILIQSTRNQNPENGYNIFANMLERSPKMGWVFMACFIGFTLYALIIFYYSLMPNRSIVITEKSITAPKSLFSTNIICIDFADIYDVILPSWYSSYLVITHKYGKLKIPRLGFSNRTIIDNVYFIIRAKLRARQYQSSLTTQ